MATIPIKCTRVSSLRRGSVAVTDLIVLVTGSLVDIADDFTYDTAKVEAFFLYQQNGI